MIDHKRKILFIHVPKNAGTSIERTVFTNYDFNNKYSLEYLIGYDKKNMINLQHATLKELIDFKYISENILNEYHSFAVVRNPFTRAISGYIWLLNDLGIEESFSNFLKRKGEFSTEKLTNHSTYVMDHFYTQSEFLTYKGNIAVKSILKFERLDKDFKKFNAEINGKYFLNIHFKKNKKKRRKLLKLFTEENLELIRDRYSEDFDNFGYTKKISKLKFLLGYV
jgi:hypothetical protein